MRTEVANTQGQLERTIADLKRTTGDMGVLSGLIATNSKQIDALKQLGDRTTPNSRCTRRKEPIKLADISILLKKADVKANRYTLELLVDDRKIEKKDRSANEPLQFYVGSESPAARAGGQPGGEGPDRRVSGHAEGAGLAPLTGGLLH